MANQLFALIKFGKEQHIKSLVENGEVYLNTIDYFKNSDHTEIGDKYEGASLIVNMEDFTITLENPSLEKPLHLKGIKGQLTNYSNEFTHCFSVYAVSNRLFEDKDSHKVDVRMQEFGTHCVLIEKPREFLGSILDEIKKITGTYAWNFVNYHDFTPLGEHKPSYFDKTKNLSHQAEYRILARLKTEEPLKIQIGNVKDYCKIWATKTMLETNWTARRSKAD